MKKIDELIKLWEHQIYLLKTEIPYITMSYSKKEIKIMAEQLERCIKDIKRIFPENHPESKNEAIKALEIKIGEKYREFILKTSIRPTILILDKFSYELLKNRPVNVRVFIDDERVFSYRGMELAIKPDEPFEYIEVATGK